MIDNAEMRRRSQEIDARSQRLEQELQALTARQSELAAGNRLSRSITNFAQRALHGIDTLDFQGRQQLLRLVLEDVRVHGWNVELRLRIPLDENPPADATIPASRTDRRPSARSSGSARPAKRRCQAMTVCVPLVRTRRNVPNVDGARTSANG